ncbi:hypothetical protein [Nocardioides sp. L-11A]|uniref:hypothetical protein n=1 Tax=Nocardioides sp. L-11A TaxID=3043848 RepID=UPI002499F49A|nr:hypothetical protein QJ852_09910 [Nocardioides sp. L-11A]
MPEPLEPLLARVAGEHTRGGVRCSCSETWPDGPPHDIDLRLDEVQAWHQQHLATAQAAALIEAGLVVRQCRVCGCTDDEACWPGSCYWVDVDLCSSHPADDAAAGSAP